MSVIKFILKSLWYFRKQNLALLAGTIISTAVMTGALIIGDSVKFSLEKLVEKRLGNAKFVLQTGDRFVSKGLANSIAKSLNIGTTSLLSLESIVINPEENTRINSVIVNGIDNSFWDLSEIDFPDLNENEAIISLNIAHKLNIDIGDEFLIRVENANIIPLNAPFVAEDNLSVAFRLKLIAFADENNMGRFSLKSNQAEPYNVFINHEFLSKELELPGLVNIVMASDNNSQDLNTESLNKCMAEVWEMTDVGIKLHKPKHLNKYELLSERIFIDIPISSAVINLDRSKESILTYFVNSVSTDNNSTPYSFVVAATAPLLPDYLGDDEIIINDWLAEDLNVKTGDTLSLDYYIIGPLRTLDEASKNFIVKEVIPVGSFQVDNSLMPLFPGMSEAGSCRDWNTGVPIDLDRIRDKDEEYWNNYKGTPKAIISLNTGQQMWNNKFGNYTAFRFDTDNTDINDLKKEIMNRIKPGDINLTFKPAREEGIRAASNSTDFGELFLSLSFFVIVAGIILTVLIYTLNTISREKESGIMAGLGFTRNKIIKIRFYESIGIAVAGGILGSLTGILYNYGLMAGLNSVWKDAVRTNFLEIYIDPITLIIGAISGILIALCVTYIVTRSKLKQTIVNIIQKGVSDNKKISKKNNIKSGILMIIGFSGAIIIVLISIIKHNENNSAIFLSAGALFIVGCIALIIRFLNYLDKKDGITVPGSVKMALRNVGRNRIRSITIIILLALGSFTIIITGANRKTFYGSEDMRQSGTGGFLFWAETTIPVLYNLNTLEGKKNLGLEYESDLEEAVFVQMFNLSGDDASCLNLNQVQQPTILGIDPELMDKRNSFSFGEILNPEDEPNPWLALNKHISDDVIPAYADQTVITWGLMKSVGDTLEYNNEKGEKIHLLIIGGLNSSVFQGNILISDSAFARHFPSYGGSRTMLIDGPADKKEQISEILDSYLIDYGIDLESASLRLARFYSVTNTYLAVFMFLGGLGVLLGTFGLGIVLLRNMIERRHEIALLLSIGYRKRDIFKMIFIENIFLLTTAIVSGILAAIIGILPSLLSPSYDIPGFFMIILVLTVFISGLLWIYFSARFSLRGNLTATLRGE